jgi:hypothetical protein
VDLTWRALWGGDPSIDLRINDVLDGDVNLFALPQCSTDAADRSSININLVAYPVHFPIVLSKLHTKSLIPRGSATSWSTCSLYEHHTLHRCMA